MQMIFPEGLNRNHPNRERESEHFDVAPLDWINLGVIEVGIGAFWSDGERAIEG